MIKSWQRIIDIAMANPEHVKILLEGGVEGWNRWRKENPEVEPNLESFSFQKIDKALVTPLLEREKSCVGELIGLDLQNAILYDANFNKMSLINVDFSNSYMRYAQLNQSSLWGCVFNETDLTMSNWSGCVAHVSNFNKSKLNNVHMRRGAFIKCDFHNASLVEADFTSSILTSSEFNESNMAAAIIVGSDLQNCSFEGAFINGIKYDRRNLKSRSLRVASAYGSQMFRRDAMDACYIAEFKEKHPFWHTLWSISSDCGRSLAQWAFWSMMIALWFGAFFWLLNLDIGFGKSFETAQLSGDSFLTMLYYSVVTFTTLGFGDVIPKTSFAAMMVMFEVILGYIMLGGLISIFANKLARRSG
ncbi:pentapeptide repeat-containing protein [Salidesulfovibrio onnuriiensis]|uniref:pentapeptide repeat-containing protein n=1 Tax=Salidesulfovibrio onnuriiensis TaxID=2583823 RepID=UPI0011CAEE0B|nr:pentapeptide repeat-containing protein [Salidesulfovibrio onnuriiensis]